MSDADDTRDELRGASDGLLIAIREVDARERQKRAVPPGDPGFPDLARDVRLAAEAVLELARREEQAATEATASRIAETLPSINASEPPRDLAAILEEWRAVERQLAEAPAPSEESSRLMERFEELRAQYAEAMKARRGES